MPRGNTAYLHGVDELIRSTPIDLVLSHYGLPVPDSSSGEYRMNCVFSPACSESKYGQLTVSLDDPANVIYCHSCEVRGNLLVLIHGLEQRCPPRGGRLRGEEFKAAVRKLREIAGLADDQDSSPEPTAKPNTEEPPQSLATADELNVPLGGHSNEAARGLATLHEELVVDIEHMPPKVAAYFRERSSWLTPEVMREWGIGYLPRDGRSMFRGWIVYTHRNEQGEVLSYSGRDVSFDEKWQKWIKSGKPDSKRPFKHKFVKGFHKGQELYGQQASRLNQAHVQLSLERLGLCVCEGMNDVVRLDALGVAAVGITSNRATDQQIAKLVRFANQTADGRVLLWPDTDEEGEAGAKELLWRLNEAGLVVRLGWSSSLDSGSYEGRQPEQLNAEEWKLLTDRL